MAVTSKVISGTLTGTASGTTDFTSSGFGTPDAAIVFYSEANSTSNPQANAKASVGFWDGTKQYSVALSTLDALSTAETRRHQSISYIAASVTGSSTSTTTINLAYTASSVTDGIRLTLTTGSSTVQRYATVVLLKGVTAKKSGILALSGSSALDVTAPGFKPDLVFFGSVGHNTTSTGSAVNSVFSFGVAHNNSSDTVSQACVMWSSMDNVGDSVVNHAIRNDGAMGQIANNSTDWVGSVGTFDASGFTVTPSADAGTDAFIYLALELPDPDDAYVGIIDSKTSTGTQAYTGAGFTPVVVGLSSCLDTAVNTLATDAYGSLALGATDGTVQQCLIVGDEDAAATTNAYSRADLSNVLNLRFDDDSVDAVAALDSFDADGFTLDYSDGSASARKVLVWAIGDSTASGEITLTAANASSATSATASAITQTHILTAANASSATTATASAISVAGEVTCSASNASSATTTTTGAVSQTHILASANASSATSATTGEITVGAVISFTAASITSTTSTTSGAIGQTHILGASNALSATLGSTAQITQTHVLLGANASSATTATGGAISFPPSGTPEPITRRTLAAAPRVTQITASPRQYRMTA